MSQKKSSKKEPLFEPSGFFAFRSPLLPFEELEAWNEDLEAPSALGDPERLATAIAADRATLRQRLSRLLERPDVLEALFVASPSLVDGLDAWRKDPESKKGRRAEEALVRYVVRMSSRATPFGLFSGCSTGTIGASTSLELAPREAYERHTRLDMDYLFALCEDLGRDAELRHYLRYRPNTSLYEAAGRLRYAEARVNGRMRSYHLVAVETADYLEKTLERARAGATVAELAQGLVDDDSEGEVSHEEAEEFLQELIDAQILVSDLTVNVTGREPVHELIDHCEALPPAGPVSRRLDVVRTRLDELDAGGLGSDPEVYREVARSLEPLGTRVELPRLFQVDMIKPARSGTLGPAVLAEIDRGVSLLHRLAGPLREDPLQGFREAFRQRYEDARDLPLVEVLDEEVGIGFDRSQGIGADASPLLKDLAFPARPGERTVRWTPQADLLLRKLEEALTDDREEIEIRPKEIESLPDEDLPPLPPAFQVMGTVAAASDEAVDRGELQLWLRGVSGPSGARLLGRFCHADPELSRFVEEHLRAEEAHYGDALVAEVVHLPEGRLGNILARPRLRAWEIPFLGLGAAPPSHQIPITDIRVSLSGERILLHSASLGRRIVPRLTSAHNFGGRNQGIYRFLCTLQSDGFRGGMGWSWGPFEGAARLPRVRCGKLILARAQWQVREEEWRKILPKPDPERYRALQDWRRRRQIPHRVLLVDADNELLVDFDNVLSVDAFLAVVRNRSRFTLVELWPDPERLCVRGPEGKFHQELVIPYVRALSSEPIRPSTTASEADSEASRTVPRALPPGSEWLYVKLYTGTATADQVLKEMVGPVVREALGSGAADQWFFIRYSDPDWHLRLRFHGEPERLLGEVLPLLRKVSTPLIDDGLVWRLQLDTYQRETERYGGPNGIELAEQLFWMDSDAVLAIVELLEGDAGADARWRLALRGSALYLSDFGLDEPTRLSTSQRMQEAFAREFRADGPFRKQLGNRLRQEKESFESLLAADWDEAHPLAPGFAILDERSRRFAPVVAALRDRETDGLLTSPLHDQVTSFIHMFNNRLLRSQGRAHEVVLYDFLHRHLQSAVVRRRAGEETARA